MDSASSIAARVAGLGERVREQELRCEIVLRRADEALKRSDAALERAKA